MTKSIKKVLSCVLIATVIFSAFPSALAEGEVTGEKVITGKRDMVWPVPESHNISSCFLDGRKHYAIDIGGKAGMEIVAAYDGKVKKVSQEGNGHGFGYYIILQHDYTLLNGQTIELYTIYSHISKALVEEWQMVKAGEPIAIIGSTGYSSGIHLDFQVHYNGWSLVYFQEHSIDPYINDLLALPDDVVLWDNWSCGEEYLAVISNQYLKQIPFEGTCLITPFAEGDTTTPSTDCTLYTEPKTSSPAVCSPYPIIIRSGQTVSVTQKLITPSGETWYNIVTENGKTGYIKESL